MKTLVSVVYVDYTVVFFFNTTFVGSQQIWAVLFVNHKCVLASWFITVPNQSDKVTAQHAGIVPRLLRYALAQIRSDVNRQTTTEVTSPSLIQARDTSP